jgi:hypothetical protein
VTIRRKGEEEMNLEPGIYYVSGTINLITDKGPDYGGKLKRIDNLSRPLTPEQFGAVSDKAPKEMKHD